MSVIVPELDLAPSVTSRVVTIDVIDMQEGAPAGGSVDFILAADLHVPADDKIIQAGSVTVTLDAAGHGEVRLPTYDPDVRPDGWGILVKKSWAPHPYLIRVPEGTAKISLADIEPVQEADPSLVSWLLTGASVSVVEGAQWGATVSTTGGVARFVFTVPPGATPYWLGDLTSASDAAALPVGVYTVPSASIATALGMPVAAGGVLTVSVRGSSTGVQTFQPWTAAAETWARTRPNSSTWTSWSRTAGSPAVPALAAAQDLDEVRTTGQYNQAVTGNATTAMHYPAGFGRGFLVVSNASASYCLQVYYGTFTGRVAMREYYSGTWGAWREPAAESAATVSTRVDAVEGAVDGLIASGGGLDIGAHAHLVREADMRRRVGRVTTAGKAAVALVFDHGTAKFSSTVLPLLRARGMRATLALNGSMFDPGYLHASTNGTVTWPDIQSWHNTDGIEIANHGLTHRGQTGLAAIRAEVVSGRERLETELGIPVDSWVQYGIPEGDPDGDGFGMGSTAAAYFTTTMGRLLLDAHAVVTGGVGTPDPTYPIDGTPPIGMWGRWLDAGTTAALDAVWAMVDRAVARGERCLVRCHPAYLDTTGSSGAYLTTAQLATFLDGLAARAVADDLVILPLREWAIATH